jgi:anti-anti-sigma factor
MREPTYEANGAGEARVRAETGGAPPAPTTAVPGRPVIGVRPDGDRVVVSVRGELDLESAEQLGYALRAALGAAPAGVDLELGGVAFCDCSALNVLLEVRELGLKHGKTVALRTVGPVVDRLLALTGTRPLFAESPPGPAEGEDPGPGGSPDPEDGVLRDLRIEVVQLRRAMQTRPVIDLARGILMASFALSAEDAWRVLVLASQHTNTKLHHLAEELVSAVRGDPPAGEVQEQVAAAVARIRSETGAEPRAETRPDD